MTGPSPHEQGKMVEKVHGSLNKTRTWEGGPYGSGRGGFEKRRTKVERLAYEPGQMLRAVHLPFLQSGPPVIRKRLEVGIL